MKASQAKEIKPLIDGLAAGETWQQRFGTDEWRDIRPDEGLVLFDPKNYRKKPEPRRLYVGQINGKLRLGHWFVDEHDFAASNLDCDETLVEFVEVLK